MVFIIVIAIIIAFVLIAILRGNTPAVPYTATSTESMHRYGERPANLGGAAKSATADLATFRDLSLETLEKFCRSLLDHYGLAFKSIDYTRDKEFHILAYYDKPLVRGNLILCGHLAGPESIVNPETVIGFSDMVKAERAMKGVFITNGFFSEEVMKLNEGASMELIDVAQLARLMTDLTPELLPKRVNLVS